MQYWYLELQMALLSPICTPPVYWQNATMSGSIIFYMGPSNASAPHLLFATLNPFPPAVSCASCSSVFLLIHLPHHPCPSPPLTGDAVSLMQSLETHSMETPVPFLSTCLAASATAFRHWPSATGVSAGPCFSFATDRVTASCSGDDICSQFTSMIWSARTS